MIADEPARRLAPATVLTAFALESRVNVYGEFSEAAWGGTFAVIGRS
jgi:hypothetical protein